MSKKHLLPRRRTQSADVGFSRKLSSSTYRREASLHNLEDAPLPPPSLMELSPAPPGERNESEGSKAGSYKEKVSALLTLPSMPSLTSPTPISPRPSLTSESIERRDSGSPPLEKKSRRHFREWAVNSWDESDSALVKERLNQRALSWDGASSNALQHAEEIQQQLDTHDTQADPDSKIPPPDMAGNAATVWLGDHDSIGKPSPLFRHSSSLPSHRHSTTTKNEDTKNRVTFKENESYIYDFHDSNLNENAMDNLNFENENDGSFRWDSGRDTVHSQPKDGQMMNRMERADSYDSDNDLSQSPSPRSRKSPHSTQQRHWKWCACCPKKRSWTRISSFVVRHAPCFWWCFSPLETSATDRAVLYRLNILCAVFAAVQAAVGVFMAIVLFAYPTPGNSVDGNRDVNLWDLNTTLILLAIVSVILFTIVVYSLRVIREVNILGAVRYMWGLYWMLPIDIFLVISIFDYHRVTNVWVKHWWLAPAMEWFRTLFCASGTAHEECMVPIGGGENFTSENEWCLYFYNSTDCSANRDAAESSTNTWCYIFYTANGIWGVLLVILLLLTMDVLQGIITSPIVQASKEANIPAWLTLPIAGCLALGCISLLSPSSVTATTDDSITGVQWIGTAYLVAAGTFTISAFLGWLLSAFTVTNVQDKRLKNVFVVMFITTMIFTILSVGAIFATSLFYSINVAPVNLEDNERGTIACNIDGGYSCTNCCDGCERQCPEWTEDDVARVLRTQLKLSATLAAIFLIYGFTALRFGFVLRSHIVNYQIDYV